MSYIVKKAMRVPGNKNRILTGGEPGHDLAAVARILSSNGVDVLGIDLETDLKGPFPKEYPLDQPGQSLLLLKQEAPKAKKGKKDLVTLEIED